MSGPRMFMSIRTSAQSEIAKSQRNAITRQLDVRIFFFIVWWQQEAPVERAGK